MSDETQEHPVRFGRLCVRADGTRYVLSPAAIAADRDAHGFTDEERALWNAGGLIDSDTDTCGILAFGGPIADINRGAYGAPVDDGHTNPFTAPADGHHEPDDHS